MLFQTTEAHEALRKEIRAFAEKEVCLLYTSPSPRDS